MANDLPKEQEFEVINVEAPEPKFGEVLEFANTIRSASQIIDFIRETYGLTDKELPVSLKIDDLIDYYSVEFDEAQDGQSLFNVYSPPADSENFKFSDLETIFNELSQFRGSDTQNSVRFLIVSFTGEPNITPIRIDVAKIPEKMTLDQQNLLVKRMQGIEAANSSKLLVLKLIKPNI